MLKFFVLAMCMCMVSGVASGKSARANKTAPNNKISPARYIAGGLLGTTFGFGGGHAIQGRWWSDYGWVFTVASMITGFQIMFEGPSCRSPEYLSDLPDKEVYIASKANYDECLERRQKQIRPWVSAFLITKGIETISVWWPRNVSFSPSPTNTEIQPYDDNLLNISEKDYVLGGVLGTFVGFGIGHAMQGRWQHKGQYYTLTQVTALGLALLGGPYCHGGSRYGKGICDNPEWMYMLGIPVFLLARIVEMFSVWGPDTSRYRIVASKSPLPFSIMPLLNTEQAGLQLTVSL